MTTLRDQLLGRLRRQTFDVLVIGGGIGGAGLARDAAMRGLRVALVERGDFASGTSSKTSKLIHGGLRYLEHGHWRLVRESLRERQILRTIAPQLVWPLAISIPIYRGDPRPPWAIGLGLTLYGWFAVSSDLGTHRLRSARAARQQEPGLNGDGLRAVASYWDCQMDDARLCLANILQAISFGAVCCNYVRVLALEKTTHQVCGAMVEDVRTAQMVEVRASVVVNATGPWSDGIRRLSDRHASRRLAPSKGIHLVVRRLTSQGLFLQARHDRRALFVLPWGDYSLIGTTESTDLSSLEDLRAEAEEVDYLLAEVNRVLPEAHVQPADVIATFAGARPLLASAGDSTRASREHRIEVDCYGLVSVMGGKYTTYRLMAQQTLDEVCRRWRFTAERCLTEQISLLEPTHPVVLDRWQEITRTIAPEWLARWLTRYGIGAFRILQLIEFEPSLAQPICPHHEVAQAELVHALQAEMACTASDLLVRRTKIAFSRCQGLDALSTVADLLARYGRVSAAEVEEQMEAYRRFLAQSLAFRAELVPAHA